MAEVMKKATRDSYGEALVELGQENPNIVVFDADLAGATKTGVFKKAFPDRFFDCGIAEGNMMVAAAGVSTCGYIPFASTFAMFAAGRAYEQIRNSIGYPHLNVKIGATHAGISVGEDGATHQCNEDIALMRTIPGMVVINPADDVEAKAAVKAAAAYVGPVYLRFGRLAAPIFNDATTYKFEMGKGITLRDGKDVTIVATGILVGEAIKAGELLAAEGIDARIIPGSAPHHSGFVPARSCSASSVRPQSLCHRSEHASGSFLRLAHLSRQGQGYSGSLFHKPDTAPHAAFALFAQDGALLSEIASSHRCSAAALPAW